MRRASDDLEYRKTAEGHAAYKFRTMLNATKHRDGVDRGANDTAGEWPSEWGTHLAEENLHLDKENLHALRCADCERTHTIITDILVAFFQECQRQSCGQGSPAFSSPICRRLAKECQR